MKKIVEKRHKVIMAIDILMGIIMLLLMIFLLRQIDWYLQLLLYISMIFLTFGIILFIILEKETLIRMTFVLNCMLSLVIVFFAILNYFGIFEKLSDMEKIRELIIHSGGFGYLVFCIIIIVQVIILPVPSFIFYLVGTAIYGAPIAFLLSYISTVIGSCINFLIGAFFGKKVVSWCVGEELTDKYRHLLNSKGYLLFIIMQILPFFPDDILCMIIGMSSMPFLFFLIIMIIVKPIYIGAVCFLGTGDIIPFSGWGIPVWILIIIGIITVYILYTKNQEKIEKYLKSKFQRKNRSEKK